MNMTKRQRNIIDMLLETSREITIAEIAEALAVSSRTVQRDIGEIEKVLGELDIALSKKAGSGIMLRANEDQIKRLKLHIGQLEITDYTPEERRLLIICRLLNKNEPVKLFTLSHDLMAAVPTISSDLDEMEQWVKRHRLALVRKRGYGVAITGSEVDRRRAIFLLASDYLDDSLLFSGNREPDADPVSRQLLNMVGREHFDRIEKALWKLDEKFPTNLSEADYTRLLIQLSVAANRFSRGFILDPGDSAGTGPPAAEELKRLYRYYAKLMDLRLPSQEEAYVMGLFSQWLHPDGDDRGLLRDDLHELELVMSWIRGVEQKMSVSLSRDPALKEGLLLHIRPALRKIMSGDAVRNPLFPQIRKDYAQLYEIVRTVVREDAGGLPIPDEEIAYLVMHFGAALERMRPHAAPVRALLVCTSGIGSSKLLAARIEKELPQIALLDHISWYEASRIPKEDYDLVISTVDLPLAEDQYIKLSPLLTPAEVEKLQHFVKRLAERRKQRSALHETQGSDPLELLSMIGKGMQAASELIETFNTFFVPAAETAGKNLPDLVRLMCERMCRMHGIGPDRIAPIAENLILREQRGSQVLGSTGLALFHTRHEAVRRPALGLFRFAATLRWPESGEREVRLILLMLGPQDLESFELEILSEFSAMLLEPGAIERLEKDDEGALKRYFADHFEKFVKNKLDWRGNR